MKKLHIYSQIFDEKVGNRRINCYPTDTYKDTYVRKGNPIASHNETCTIAKLSTFTKS